MYKHSLFFIVLLSFPLTFCLGFGPDNEQVSYNPPQRRSQVIVPQEQYRHVGQTISDQDLQTLLTLQRVLYQRVDEIAVLILDIERRLYPIVASVVQSAPQQANENDG